MPYCVYLILVYLNFYDVFDCSGHVHQVVALDLSLLLTDLQTGLM